MRSDALRPRLAALHAAALLAALLAGCASQQEVTVQRETTQTFAPTTLVEVLPALPAQGYVRIAVLDAQSQPGTPEAQLLAQLQAKAGALGANAIVVQNLSTREGGTVQYNPAGGQFTTTPSVVVPHLRAEAIHLGPAK
jgi:hypothetical protein